MGNAYLEKQKAVQEAYFKAGIQTGRQQIMDMVSLVLRDPDIMGRDIFGKDRLIKVIKGVDAYMGIYEKAWQRDPETDYFRDKMDEALAEAYGDGLRDTFAVRYEFAPKYEYAKGKWK